MFIQTNESVLLACGQTFGIISYSVKKMKQNAANINTSYKKQMP